MDTTFLDSRIAIFTIVVALITFSLLVLVRNMSESTARGLMSLLLRTSINYAKSSAMNTVVNKFSKRTTPKHLPQLNAVEKVSERVYRVLGLNPGPHTLQGTNTYLVKGIHSSSHVLIDTGEGSTSKEYISQLFDEVFPVTRTKHLSKILLSHGHYDHQGGVLAILHELTKRNMLPLPKVYKRSISDGMYPATGYECIDIKNKDIFVVDSDTNIVALYTPGHTDDHVAFVLREEELLFSGDCVLGCGTAVFDDLYDYMKSLQLLHKLTESTTDGEDSIRIRSICPGHGLVIRDTAKEKIEEYIAHRSLRETQLLEVLDAKAYDRSSVHWVSSWDLVALVYGKLPSLIVKLSAQNNLMHHLEKLKKENRVSYRWPDLWAIHHEPNSNERSYNKQK